MSAHTKKLPIKTKSGHDVTYSESTVTYKIPFKNIGKYNIPKRYISEVDKPITTAGKTSKKASINSLFEKLDNKFTKAGSLLKGLRFREGLTQIEFAQKINVTQANLSNMENGRRPIGKIIAKRIEEVFGTNYRYFLE